MAPERKRKAPPSSKPSGGGAKPSHPAGSKRPALSTKQLKYRPPPVKKARVEVEYEESAPSKGGKKSQATGGGASGQQKGKGREEKKGDKAGETNGRPLKKKEIERLKAEAAEKKALKALGGAAATKAPEVAATPSTSTLKSSTAKAPSTKKQLSFADDHPTLPTSTPSASTSEPAQPFKKTTPRVLLPPKTFQIITGSYEKLLYGLSGTFPLPSTPVEERDYTIKPIFIFPAHQACVKAVAASEGGKWLATGSTDEVVKIWDLRRRKEVGGLVQHSGSITSLLFPTRTHLLTASEDATLTLFRTRDWTMLRSFKGHTGRINSIAVHPTGKLALTVGKDRTMRMWDLMRGKAGGAVKLGKEGEVLRFSPSGQTFAVLSTTTIDLYTKDMSPILTLTNSKRFHDFHFLEIPSSTPVVEGEPTPEPREMLFAAVEDGFTRVWERVGGRMGDLGVKEEGWTELVRLGGHENRVKSLSPLYPLLSTISSDGFINLYDLTLLPPTPSSTTAVTPVPVQLPQGQYDTKGTRLTCLTMAEGERGVEGVDEEDVEGDEEEWGGIGSESEEESEEGSEEGLSGEDMEDMEEEDEMEGEEEEEEDE
ncbi:WD40-repeat-containing domain protein [Mrakia frigida]|uniref:WD40-repeat-containing domain protein n=1 Tax=Mrakia frigida TaxID=29902 RepID=UPI003FCBF4D8